MNRKIRVLGVVSKIHPPARALLKTLAAYARKRRITLVCEEATARYGGLHGTRTFSRDAFPSGLDALLVIGGDGTLLAAARMAADRSCPLMGVNTGRLGFLTTVPHPMMMKALDALVHGGYEIEERAMLRVVLARKGRVVASQSALNDIVVSKGDIARIVTLDLEVEGRLLATVRADGVVVSTPTGSTAYSLSAGGPIVHPAMNAFIVTPIAPHSLALRPVVVSDRLTVALTLRDHAPNTFLTIDGQTAVPLRRGDIVRVERGRRKTCLIRLPGQNFFGVLREKLRWGTH